ncbi:MAG: GWxTD domain-containing protein [Bacteroidales bacterium]|nr:GWxTD domain-containing protein [Bacteroidales bacterium]
MNTSITISKKVFVTLMLLLVAFTGNAQTKKLKSYLSTTTYCVPGMTPYVENAIAFDCRTAVYKQFEPGKFKATVEVVTVFRKGEESVFSKVAVDSPVVTDTTKLDGAFIDQQRFSLANGEYQMEICITDLNSGDVLPPTTVTVEVNYPDNTPAISDILLFDSYSKAVKPNDCTKSGFDFLPRVYPFYGANENKLNFYAEIYNSDKLYDEGKFLVNYYIETVESSNRMQNYFFNKRFDVKKVDVLLNTIDISELPSGNYYLVVEMHDRSNELICSKSWFFQRSNPNVAFEMEDLAGVNVANTFVGNITEIDTLRKYIRYLDPICSEMERDYSSNLVRTDDMKTMQQFLFNFWSKRFPMNPKQGFDDYLAAVRRVNMSFSTTAFPGYRSDRGYVFLKYGQPDKIMEVPDEPAALPYEIWHYYEVANQHNKKFVFVAPDRSSNDYQLIHSNMVGEINNPRWQMEIYGNVYGQGYDQGVDQTEYERGWGSHAGDLYNNPR